VPRAVASLRPRAEVGLDTVIEDVKTAVYIEAAWGDGAAEGPSQCSCSASCAESWTSSCSTRGGRMV
jgi:hypothetical protein